jgi:hypothetical protein
MPLHNNLIETVFSKWNSTILRGEVTRAPHLPSAVEALEASGDIQRGLVAALR